MKALINRLISRNTPKPRKYKVPEGLVDRVLYLVDKYEHFKLKQAKRELWKLIEDRCPDVRKGQWKICVDGSEVFVEEVIA